MVEPFPSITAKPQIFPTASKEYCTFADCIVRHAKLLPSWTDVLQLRPTFPIPCPSVAKHGHGIHIGVESPEQENVGSVVDDPMESARRRTSIGHLSPLCAIVLPCVIQKSGAAGAAKQDNSVTNGIVSQYRGSSSSGPGILFLRPLIAIPNPGIAAAKKHDEPSLAVECNCGKTLSHRAGIRDLCPFSAVPFPSVCQIPIRATSTKEDSALAVAIIGYGMRVAACGTHISRLCPLIPIPLPSVC